MNASVFAFGREIAHSLPLPSQSCAMCPTTLSTVQDLLSAIDPPALGPKKNPMLWTAARKISELTGLTFDKMPLEALLDAGSAITVYLKERRYSANTVRTHRHSIRRLLLLAKELGWISARQPLAESGEPILLALKTQRHAPRSIIEFAIANGIKPQDFCEKRPRTVG